MLNFFDNTAAKVYDVEHAEHHQQEMESEHITLKGGDITRTERIGTQSGSHDDNDRKTASALIPSNNDDAANRGEVGSTKKTNTAVKSPSPPNSSSSNDALTIELDPEIFRMVSYASFWVMMLLSGIITHVAVDVPSPNPLELTFGYSNICLYFDYDPPRIFAALFYPLVEYSMVLYIVLNWISIRRVFDLSKDTDKQAYIAFTILSAIEIILIAWFRMVFVIRAFVDLTGHTLPFIGLQITLCLVSVQNCIYYYFWHQGVDYSDLHKYGSDAVLGILAFSYTALLIAVTVGKIVLTGSILDGHPVMPIGTPAQKAVGTTFDTVWVILAAVVPLFISAYLVSKKGKPKAIISFA